MTDRPNDPVDPIHTRAHLPVALAGLLLALLSPGPTSADPSVDEGPALTTADDLDHHEGTTQDRDDPLAGTENADAMQSGSANPKGGDLGEHEPIASQRAAAVHLVVFTPETRVRMGMGTPRSPGGRPRKRPIIGRSLQAGARSR